MKPTANLAHRLRGLPPCTNTDEEALALCRRVEKMTPEETRAFVREKNAEARRKRAHTAPSARRPTSRSVTPQPSARPASRIDTTAIYRDRNRPRAKAASHEAPAQAEAPATPRTMGGIAAAHYGGAGVAAGAEVIGSSRRGGGR